MNVNQAAFCTTTVLAVATVATVIAAATTATTVATIAYSILAVGLGAVSIASITAWIDSSSLDVPRYFENMKKHAGYAIAGSFTFVAQTLVTALIQGIANGISRAIGRKIGGDDITVRVN